MKTLELRLDDKVMSELEALCAEQHMDASAAAGEAVRLYVAAERARLALGATDLVSVYAEFTGEETGLFSADREDLYLS